MPLYMDLHHIDPNITQEDLDEAHRKDLEIQDKYGISHKKYYVNFKEKTVFCLMEGPDKEAIHSGHAEVHGVGPCNIIEVSSLTPTFNFNSMIGEEGGKNRWDVALTKSGEIDTGFRTLILITLLRFTSAQDQFVNDIFQVIENYDGKIVQQPDQKILVSFLHAQEAILCLNTLLGYFRDITNIEFNIAVVTGKPVDETSSLLFENAIHELQALSTLGRNNLAYVDSSTKTLYEKGLAKSTILQGHKIRYLSPNDIAMFKKLKEILEENLGNANLRTNYLCTALGLSKTQCYRKIKELTGMSPSGLIQEIRLRKSLIALKSTKQTVSEIAFEQGFNSANYFTRAFKRRFSLLPTEFTSRNN